MSLPRNPQKTARPYQSSQTGPRWGVARSAHANGRRVYPKATAYSLEPDGTLYTVRTTAGTQTVRDDGPRWAPGSPVPEGCSPNALRALVRNARAGEAREAERGGRERRAA